MRTFAIRHGARTLPMVVLLAFFLVLPASGQEGRPLTFTDLMQLREIEQPSIAANGRWIAFTAEPDRGDPEVIVRAVEGDARYVIPLASNPVISPDGSFVAARLNPENPPAAIAVIVRLPDPSSTVISTRSTPVNVASTSIDVAALAPVTSMRPALLCTFNSPVREIEYS